MKKSRTRMTEEDREMIRSMLKRGMVGVDIAYETGRSLATISKIRKEMERNGEGCWHNPGVVSRYIPVL